MAASGTGGFGKLSMKRRNSDFRGSESESDGGERERQKANRGRFERRERWPMGTGIAERGISGRGGKVGGGSSNGFRMEFSLRVVLNVVHT